MAGGKEEVGRSRAGRLRPLRTGGAREVMVWCWGNGPSGAWTISGRCRARFKLGVMEGEQGFLRFGGCKKGSAWNECTGTDGRKQVQKVTREGRHGDRPTRRGRWEAGAEEWG